MSLVNLSVDKPLDITDFSGGTTDHDRAKDPRVSRVIDNLWTTHNQKLRTRPGSIIYDLTNYRSLEGTRINSLINFKAPSKLLIGSSKHVYLSTVDIAGANRLLGPVNSNPAFTAGDANSRVSFSEWNGHMFVTNDSGAKPIKIFRDDAGTVRVRTAGLPALANTNNYGASLLADAITLAGTVRTNMRAHFTSTPTLHKVSDTVSDGLVDTRSMVTEADLIAVVKTLIKAYSNHIQDTQTNQTFHYLQDVIRLPMAYATYDAMLLTITTDPTDMFDCANILDDMITRHNTHDGSWLYHLTKATPQEITSTPLLATRGPKIAFAYDGLYAFANRLRTGFNAHMLDGVAATSGAHRGASAPDNNAGATPAATTPRTLAQLTASLRQVYTKRGAFTAGHDEDARLASPNYHGAQEVVDRRLSFKRPDTNTFGDDDYLLGVNVGDFLNTTAALNDFQNKFYGHQNDLTTHALGEAAANFITNVNISLGKWSYAFHYKYEYKIDDVTFEDFGPVTIKTLDFMVDPAFYPQAITAIPAITNAANSNSSWDTATITVEIYRTLKDGATFFKVGSITNGTTTFTDRLSDDQIILNEKIYTTGGVLDNSPPPIADYLHIMDDTAYYASVTDADGNYIPNRLQTSKAGDPDSCPTRFFLDFPDVLKGVKSVRSRPVVGTTIKMYRIEGSFDDAGNGGLRYEEIAAGTGLASNGSMVQAEELLFFAGTDTFYMTNGFDVIPISERYDLFQSLQNKTNIQGVYNKANRMIHWAVQLSPDSSGNDAILTLDLNQPLERLRSCITVVKGESDFNASVVGVFPDVDANLGEQLLRGDLLGYVYKHDDVFDRTDPMVNTSTAPTNWFTRPVIHTYSSTFQEHGMEGTTKWGQAVAVDVIKETDLSLDMKISNDLGRVESYLKPMILRNQDYPQITPDGQNPSHLRPYAEGTFRFQNTQLTLTNNRAVIQTWSARGALATIDASAKTVTLASTDFTKDLVNYFIAFEVDGFVREYLITSWSLGVLTYKDLDNKSVSGVGKRWVIRGYPKGEILHLQSVSLYARALQPQMTPFAGRQLGDPR